MLEGINIGTTMRNSDADTIPHTECIAKNNIRVEVDPREERISLENRVSALQKGLSKIQKDNSILKMKAVMTMGSMRLQIESLEEDKQFLVEKCIDLKKKMKVSQQDYNLKQTELATLQSKIHDPIVLSRME